MIRSEVLLPCNPTAKPKRGRWQCCSRSSPCSPSVVATRLPRRPPPARSPARRAPTFWSERRAVTCSAGSPGQTAPGPTGRSTGSAGSSGSDLLGVAAYLEVRDGDAEQADREHAGDAPEADGAVGGMATAEP